MGPVSSFSAPHNGRAWRRHQDHLLFGQWSCRIMDILKRSAYHEIGWGLLSPSAAAVHILGISECKYFNPYTLRKSQSKCALKLVLEYSEHTMCPNYQLGPDSSRNMWQSDICPVCFPLAWCSTAAGRGPELIRGNLAGQQYQLAVTLTRDKTNS